VECSSWSWNGIECATESPLRFCWRDECAFQGLLRISTSLAETQREATKREDPSLAKLNALEEKGGIEPTLNVSVRYNCDQPVRVPGMGEPRPMFAYD